VTKTYQGQLILGEYESIIWHCGHEHKTRQEARDCLRKNQPEVAERIVESDKAG
jgi:hypothetical protein